MSTNSQDVRKVTTTIDAETLQEHLEKYLELTSFSWDSFIRHQGGPNFGFEIAKDMEVELHDVVDGDDFDDLQTQYDTLEDEQEVLQHQYDTLEGDHNELKAKCDQLQQQLNTLTTENEDLKKQISELVEQHTKLSTSFWKKLFNN